MRLINLRKVTRSPSYWIGQDDNGRWKIQDSDGKIHKFSSNFELEAQETAINMALGGIQWNPQFKKMRIEHREKLATFEALQYEYM